MEKKASILHPTYIPDGQLIVPEEVLNLIKCVSKTECKSAMRTCNHKRSQGGDPAPPNWNATNDKKAQTNIIVSSVYFSIFTNNTTRVLQ